MTKPCWIQTVSGLRFEPMDPNPTKIVIEDIAHALSNLCRFTGHTREFYSVAQHSVIASHAITELPEIKDRVDGAMVAQQFARAALLHDASEAYLVDVPSPIKPHLLGYEKIEIEVSRAIAFKFNLEPDDFHHPLIKWIDRKMLATEARDLMGGGESLWSELLDPLDEVIVPWSPKIAKHAFMTRYRELFL